MSTLEFTTIVLLSFFVFLMVCLKSAWMEKKMGSFKMVGVAFGLVFIFNPVVVEGITPVEFHLFFEIPSFFLLFYLVFFKVGHKWSGKAINVAVSIVACVVYLFLPPPLNREVFVWIFVPIFLVDCIVYGLKEKKKKRKIERLPLQV